MKALRILLLILFLLGAVVAAGLGTLSCTGNAAFRDERAAWRAFGGPESLLDLAPDPVVPADNAAIVYQRAFDALPADADPGRDGADRDAVLRDYADVLALVREAQQRPRCVWPTRYEDGFMAELPHIAQALKISRLLVLEAEARIDAGDRAGAAESIAAGLKLAEHVAVDVFLVNVLVAAAIDTMMIDTIERAFATGTIPDSTIDEQLASRNYPAWLRTSLLAEVGAVLMHYDRGDIGDQLPLLAGIHGVEEVGVIAWRLGWHGHDAAYYLREMREGIESIDAEPHIDVAFEQPPKWAILSNVVMPAIEQARRRITSMQLRVEMARLAILERSGAAVTWPDDPFTGDPLVREDGVVRSPGPDRADGTDDDVVFRWGGEE